MSRTNSLRLRDIAQLLDFRQMLGKRFVARLFLLAECIGSRFIDQLFRLGLGFQSSLLKFFL